MLTDHLGLPLTATGNVVVVFRMRLAEGEVALRCFTRKASFEVLAHRYRALNRRLKQVDVPVLVPCAYQPDEILVAGVRYPVVMMPWVPGRQLHRYVEQHLHKPGVLHALADQWRILMKQLRTARIAHGDLADGNVLVESHGQIHLIDYDAAFVPALEDEPPSEIGKPNYQHPDRLNPDGPDYGYYAANVDAFAALVVYLSLRALADDAERWRCYHTGENLIFEQDDYQNPGYTPVWLDLRNSKNREVRRLVEVLDGYCRASLADLPNLEEALQGKIPRRRVGKPKEALLAEGKAPVPPPRETHALVEATDEPAPEAQSERTALLRTLYLPGLAVVAVLALVVWLSWGGQADETMRRASLSTPSEAIAGELPPGDLAGFYTGYATSTDGAREPMALIIDSLKVYPDSAEAHFTYSINWKAHHAGGVGRYNRDTGHLDLDSHYVLYVARATTREVVLASLSHRDQRPLVRVNKRRTP